MARAESLFQIGMTKGKATLFFYYDESGSPTSFSYNGIMHCYVKNLQGDIVKIVNGHGDTVASYEYDAWGKILSIKNYYGAKVTDPQHVALLNPFRYRGYVYDDETGLYYLQSRYYDPITCRFLNADIYCDTGTGFPLSTNMFAYCENNSINYIDINGFISCSASKTSKNEVKVTIKFSDNDIRKIKFGITSSAIIFDSICGVIAAYGGIPTLGISTAVAVVAGIVVSAICGLTVAYIDYKDHGKGATITVYFKYGFYKVKYLQKVYFWKYIGKNKWKYNWKYAWKTINIPYAYISRIPRLTWIK